MIFSYFKRRRAERVLAQLTIDLRDPKSAASKRVDEKAAILAGIHVMKWLDNQRIRRCAVCPSTQTLKKVQDKFLCPNHVNLVAFSG